MDVVGTYGGVKFLPNGDTEISFIVAKGSKSTLLQGVEELEKAGTSRLRIRAEKERKKRSLDANDYLWVLCTKIAEKLQDGKVMITKEDVYRKHIEAVGKYEPLAMAENAVERFSQVWTGNGTGWLVKVVDSKLDGCKKVFAYYGSSVYDSREMSRLIESVIEDCRALEIEIMPPAELEALVEAWGQKGE